METNTTPTLKAHAKYFAPYTNSDLCEGRGQEYPAAFCKNESTAIRLAKGKYVQGTDCSVHEVQTYLIDGKVYAPIGRVVEPTNEDLILERELAEKRKSAILRDRFLKGETLTDEERLELAKQFK